MPPQVCPPPPDCPLYEQRVSYGFDEPLRRAILTERTGPDLAALIRSEARESPPPLEAEVEVPSPADPVQPVPRPALPAAEPVPLSILDQLNKESQ